MASDDEKMPQVSDSVEAAMKEDEAWRLSQQLLAEEKARKQAELEALDELMGELPNPLKPRHSLARSPVRKPTTPPPRSEAPRSSKRPLQSPEEVSKAVRKRLEEKSTRRKAGGSVQPVAPPIGGILSTATPRPQRTAQPAVTPTQEVAPRPPTMTPQPAPTPVQVPPPVQVSAAASRPPSTPLQDNAAPTPPGPVGTAAPLPGPLDKAALLSSVHDSIKGIGLVANNSNKLNMADKTTIAAHGQDILACFGHLALGLADKEREVLALRLQVATISARLETVSLATAHTGASSAPAPAVPQEPSYASRLKMPKGKPPMEVQPQKPTVIFYPETGSTDIKTSDDTKKALQSAVKPAESGIKVTQVLRVGNSGVVVRTASEESAQRLRDAVPPGLRVATPKPRLPRVALRYIRSQLSGEQLIEEMHRVNLAEDADWPLSRFREECKFGIAKPLGPKFLVILDCSLAARDKLVGLGRVYIGWDEAEVCDHVRSTCCTKCQQYGHPEKYCRSKDQVCGNCGEVGHKNDQCTAKTRCCATCKRFKRADASTHTTAAANCPARLHAEQQEAAKTLYR